MHGCQPWSHCQGRAWAVVASVFNPSPLLKGGKNRPVIPQGCQGDIFFGCRAVPAAELAGAVCWELERPVCPCTRVPLPRATQQHGATRREMQLGGSQAQGWGDSRTLEEPCRDEK